MPRFATRWLLALSLIATAMPLLSRPATAAATSPSATPGRPRVVLWGDSLAYESAPAFAEVLDTIGRPALTRTFPGTAPCDWLDDIRLLAGRGPLDAVVLEFSGNAFTPCMQGPGGRPLTDEEVEAAYSRDLRLAIAALAPTGAQIYLAGAPAFSGETPGDRHALVRDLAQQLAAAGLARYVAAGAAVTPTGQFTATLPCRPWERPDDGCRGGRVTVRSPDGVHFCPHAAGTAAGLIAPCPVPSPGAERFGQAMAAPVASALLLRSVRAVV